MIGAIIGDVIGSVYEFNNIKTKNFPLFSEGCFATDDSIMSIAVADAFLRSMDSFADLQLNTIKIMRTLGERYPKCGFGGRFAEWLKSDNPLPYNSWGNGAAMRISAVAWVGNSIEEVKKLSKMVTEITHNHSEGLKGAEATAVAIFMARMGKSKEEIKQYICDNYYNLDFTLDEIRENYEFNESCMETCPQAFVAFLEGTDFEDCIRNAISIGGDSDTLACITGAIAEAFYGVSKELRRKIYLYLSADLLTPLQIFEAFYCNYMSDSPHTTMLAIKGSYKNFFDRKVQERWEKEREMEKKQDLLYLHCIED